MSVQECGGLRGTNRRRSSKLFPSRLFWSPTTIPAPERSDGLSFRLIPPPRASVLSYYVFGSREIKNAKESYCLSFLSLCFPLNTCLIRNFLYRRLRIQPVRPRKRVPMSRFPCQPTNRCRIRNRFRRTGQPMPILRPSVQGLTSLSGSLALATSEFTDCCSLIMLSIMW